MEEVEKYLDQLSDLYRKNKKKLDDQSFPWKPVKDRFLKTQRSILRVFLPTRIFFCTSQVVLQFVLHEINSNDQLLWYTSVSQENLRKKW